MVELVEEENSEIGVGKRGICATAVDSALHRKSFTPAVSLEPATASFTTALHDRSSASVPIQLNRSLPLRPLPPGPRRSIIQFQKKIQNLNNTNKNVMDESNNLQIKDSEDSEKNNSSISEKHDSYKEGEEIEEEVETIVDDIEIINELNSPKKNEESLKLKKILTDEKNHNDDNNNKNSLNNASIEITIPSIPEIGIEKSRTDRISLPITTSSSFIQSCSSNDFNNYLISSTSSNKPTISPGNIKYYENTEKSYVDTSNLLNTSFTLSDNGTGRESPQPDQLHIVVDDDVSTKKTKRKYTRRNSSLTNKDSSNKIPKKKNIDVSSSWDTKIQQQKQQQQLIDKNRKIHYENQLNYHPNTTIDTSRNTIYTVKANVSPDGTIVLVPNEDSKNYVTAENYSNYLDIKTEVINNAPQVSSTSNNNSFDSARHNIIREDQQQYKRSYEQNEDYQRVKRRSDSSLPDTVLVSDNSTPSASPTAIPANSVPLSEFVHYNNKENVLKKTRSSIYDQNQIYPPNYRSDILYHHSQYHAPPNYPTNNIDNINNSGLNYSKKISSTYPNVEENMKLPVINKNKSLTEQFPTLSTWMQANDPMLKNNSLRNEHVNMSEILNKTSKFTDVEQKYYQVPEIRPVNNSVMINKLPAANSSVPNESINMIPANKWPVPQYHQQQQVKVIQQNPSQTATLQHTNFRPSQFSHYPPPMYPGYVPCQNDTCNHQKPLIYPSIPSGHISRSQIPRNPYDQCKNYTENYDLQVPMSSSKSANYMQHLQNASAMYQKQQPGINRYHNLNSAFHYPNSTAHPMLTSTHMQMMPNYPTNMSVLSSHPEVYQNTNLMSSGLVNAPSSSSSISHPNQHPHLQSNIYQRNPNITSTSNYYPNKGTVTNYQCSYCGKLSPMFQCNYCQSTFYCSKQCQMQHWDVHVTVCRK